MLAAPYLRMSQQPKIRDAARNVDFDEACRLLDGAMDVLSRWVDDPKAAPEGAASTLIDDLRSWGRTPEPQNGTQRKNGSH